MFMSIIKKCFFMFVAIACICAIIVMLWFCVSHTLSVRYNDLWIIGKTKEEIQNRYGEFDENGDNLGYRLGSLDFYVIDFDERGVAQSIFVRHEP